MRPSSCEWVRCAEEDFDVATALMRRRNRTAANSIGFHAQQCVEKYFKARLDETGLNVPRTHDLMALLQLLLGVEPLWVSFAPSLRRLNDYAVKFRYPGQLATRVEAREALRACRAVRAEVRLSLGLPRK